MKVSSFQVDIEIYKDKLGQSGDRILSSHITTYVIEIKETFFETSIMSIGFASFKHLKLPISIKIPVTVSQIVYIYMTAISPNLISLTMLLLGW